MRKYRLPVFLTVVLLLPLLLAVQSSSWSQTVATVNLGQEEMSVTSDIFYWEVVQLTDNVFDDNYPQIDDGMVTWSRGYGAICLYDGLSVEYVPVEDGVYYVSPPQIDNGTVVYYAEMSDYTREIFLYDGVSLIRITENEVDDYDPQIHNGMVTWVGFDGNDDEIFFWNGTVHQLTDNDYDDWMPQIDNGMVTWFGYDGSDNEVFLWNGTVHQLTDNSYGDRDSQIDNGIVTWCGSDGNDDEIFFWNGTVHQLTDNDYDDWEPKIDAGLVTWVGFDGNDDEIFFWNGTVHQLTDNDYEDDYPQVDNGVFTWNYYDGWDWEVFLWDGTMHQLTDNDYDDNYPQINDGMGAFHGSDGNDDEIFIICQDTTPPVIDHPDDVVIEGPPAGHTIVWNPSDANPASYDIKRNGITVQSGSWTGGSISIDLDGLPSGGYEFECTVYDGPGMWVSDSVMLQLIPEEPSWIFAPTDQVIAYGEPFDYQLAVVDPSGIHYWWINDTENFDLNATYYYDGSTARLTNKSTLALGEYGISIEVTDLDGHTLSGSFVVIVTDVTPPTWTEIYPAQLVEYGDAADFFVSASDPSGLSKYWVEDTRFSVDLTGRVRSVELLPVGELGLVVFVNDSYSNVNATYITIIVDDTTAPSWISQPENQEMIYGTELSYQLEAFDLSGIANWHVNDTEHFLIVDGLLMSSVTLSPGTYGLEVSVIDLYGNRLSSSFTIRVTESTTTETTSTTTSSSTTSTSSTTTTQLPPDGIVILLSVGGLAVVVIIIAVMAKRRS